MWLGDAREFTVKMINIPSGRYRKNERLPARGITLLLFLARHRMEINIFD